MSETSDAGSPFKKVQLLCAAVTVLQKLAGLQHECKKRSSTPRAILFTNVMYSAQHASLTINSDVQADALRLFE
jgi:hypothetical protein